VPSFGERLKREREKRKISLDDIALSTKIGTRMLVALEEEKFDQLPGGIFNKGFVRAYARHVGIDEEQAIADYLDAVGQSAPLPPIEPAPHDVRIVPVHEPESREETKSLPWGTLAGVLLVLALALSVWSFLKRETPEAPRATTSSPRPTPTSSTTTPTPDAAHAGASPTSATPASRASGSPINLTIKAFDDCWVSIIADGKPVIADGEIASGTSKTIEATREIVVKAGNVGALDFSLNGKPLGRQGQEGQVRTLTFGREGLVNAPAAKENVPPPPPA
jgi:cytoskeleton protein RodZ